MIIQFSCPCGTDRLDFVLLSQFIKIVNICAKTYKKSKTGERLMLIANDLYLYLLNVKALLASRFLALRSIHKALSKKL